MIDWDGKDEKEYIIVDKKYKWMVGIEGWLKWRRILAKEWNHPTPGS